MVKKGYKKTEVGVIPEDWEVKYLKQISPSQSVGLVINPSSYFDEKGTVPSLVGSQISENHINWEIANRITEASNESLPASRLKAGDLVTVRVGEPGITAVVPPELDGCNCASMMIVRQHPSFNSLWLCYMMNSRLGKAQINHVQYGTAQKQFNISDAIDFIYPVPPFPEQKTIAQTLSDVDALIAALDKHIAKKRNIKTGTMQQLLTGKTRLPGFGEGKGYKKSAIGVIPEDWEVDDLGKFITEFRGGAPLKPSDFTNGGVKVLPKGAVVRGGFLKINDKDLQFCSKQYANHYGKNKINNTYIVVVLRDLVPSGPSIGLIVKIKKPEIYILAQGVYGFKTQGIIDEYLIQYSNSFPYRKLMNEIMVGSTQVHITNTAFKAIKLPFPPLPQQKAIAQVLSDIDTEITALEKRRAKTQAIKQGMMQELLTGRTRLKIEHPDDPITKNSNG